MCLVTAHFGRDISMVGYAVWYAFSNTTGPEECFRTEGIASKYVVRLRYNAGKGTVMIYRVMSIFCEFFLHGWIKISTGQIPDVLIHRPAKEKA